VILDPRSGQAASNSSPRRRAGSEISLFQPRPAEKKKKPAHKSGLSPIFFAQPRTTDQIFCAYGACAAAVCNPKSKKAAFAAFFEVLY